MATAPQRCSSCSGMAVASAFGMQGTLAITDTPLTYSCPVGPQVGFTISYIYLDQNEPEEFTFSNLGPDWSFNYLSYLNVDPDSMTATVRIPSGGSEVLTYDFTTSSWTRGLYSNAILTSQTVGSDTSYTLTNLDGSYETYDLTDTNGNLFMTSMTDAQNNTATIQYDSNFRITSVTDTIGQESVLTYATDTVGDAGFYVITAISGPFGRTCSFTYDSTYTYLLSSTDQIGLTSSFHYQSGSSFIDRMTTPYGTTGFYTWTPDSSYESEGLQFLYPDGTSSAIISETYQSPATYFYSREVMMEYPGDIVPGDDGFFNSDHCYQTFWCVDGAPYGNQTAIPYKEFPPLENEIDYTYAGGEPESGTENYYFINGNGLPATITRTTAGTTTQTWQYEYNDAGNVTQAIDPAGRTFQYSFDTNNVDLLEKEQTLTSTPDINGIWSGYTNHLPGSYKDGSGQVWSFTYNGFGELETITYPNANVTTMTHDSNGYLTQIDGPLPGSQDVTTLSYDGYGRIYQIMNSEGYTLTYSYDNADRITQITYPDGTSVQKIYDKLDTVLVKDRIGRWTQSDFDSLDQLRFVLDPLGRKTKYDWCACGSLMALTDPAGNKTCWNHDVEGRVVSKTYADGSQYSFGYDTVGRLASRLDANKQTTNYSYNIDNTLAGKSYENAINATSDVTYLYDPDYVRLTSVENGWGTNSYSYNPYITSSSATTTGAGKVSEITNSVISNSDITFSYDVLGRVTNRSINGSSNSIDWAYDAMSRVTSETNALGEFDYDYVDDASGQSRGTTRLSSINYPNGQVTHFNWFGNEKDQRLQGIINLKSDGTCLSQFNYGYNPAGEITAWQQQQAGSNQPYALGYDRAGQLISSKSGFYGTISPSYTSEYFYDYDKAGNRTSSTQYTNTPVTIAGSTTAGDILSITVLDSGLSGGQETVSYTVQSGDGLDDVAYGLSLAIYNDSNLYPIGIGSNSGGSQLYIYSSSPNVTSYQSSVSSGATESIAFGDNTNSLTNVLAVGTATVGDTITIIANDPTLSGGSESVSYTVASGDSLTDIVTALISAVNSDSALNALPVYGYYVQNGGQLISESANTTTFTQSVSAGATEALEFSLCTNVAEQAMISGTPTPGDVVTITAYDSSLSGGSYATSYTVQSGDDATAVANGIANAIAGDATMSSIIDAYTDGGPVALLSSFSMNLTRLRATTSSGATETVVLGENVNGDYYTPSFGGTAYQYNPLNELFTTNNGGTAPMQATTNKALQAATVSASTINIQQATPPTTTYSTPEYSSATESLAIDWPQFGNDDIAVNGTVTPGDVLSFIVQNKNLPGGRVQLNYTVQSTDGLDDIAAGFAAAINASSELAAVGIDASSEDNYFYPAQEVATYDFSVSSENEWFNWGPDSFGNIYVEVDGTPTSGDVFTITGYNPAFPSGSTTASYTVGSTDSLNSIAAGLAAAINANSSMTGIGLSATNSAPTTLNWSQKFSANPAVLYSTQTIMSGTDGGGNSASSPPYTIYSNSNYAVLTYDYNGNMTNDGTSSYSWDAENRLIQITYPGTGNSSSFAYDGLSYRVGVIESRAGSAVSSVQFVVHKNELLEEYDGMGALTKEFFERGQTTGGETNKYFYAPNKRGDVASVTDSLGNDLSELSYTDWGQSKTLAGTFVPDFGYAGMYLHEPSGLYLSPNRVYSPNLARWLSRDRSSLAEVNDYIYADNEPVNHVDKTGLQAATLAGSLVAPGPGTVAGAAIDVAVAALAAAGAVGLGVGLANVYQMGNQQKNPSNDIIEEVDAWETANPDGNKCDFLSAEMKKAKGQKKQAKSKCEKKKFQDRMDDIRRMQKAEDCRGSSLSD